MSSLVGSNVYGTSSASNVQDHIEAIDGKTNIFKGRVYVTNSFTEAKVQTYVFSFLNTFAVQWAKGMTEFTNTLCISGPTDTGLVSYCVVFIHMTARDGANIWSPSYNYQVRHNDTPITLIPVMDDTVVTVFTSAVQSIVFGQPFTLSFSLEGQISCGSLDVGPEGSLFLQEVVLALNFINIWDSQGNLLDKSGSNCTITSEGKGLYPSGPTLFPLNSSTTNMTLYWHSMTNAPYQLKYCTNLIECAWSNYSNIVTGQGSTNFIDLPIIDTEPRYYRVTTEWQ